MDYEVTQLCPPFLQSQAEAHYKGNRHARRVKGIETSKTRPQEGDKQPPPPNTSPSPPRPSPSSPEPDPSSKQGKAHLCVCRYHTLVNTHSAIKSADAHFTRVCVYSCSVRGQQGTARSVSLPGDASVSTDEDQLPAGGPSHQDWPLWRREGRQGGVEEGAGGRRRS